jgi:hypothetical protein
MRSMSAFTEAQAVFAALAERISPPTRGPPPNATTTSWGRHVKYGSGAR